MVTHDHEGQDLLHTHVGWPLHAGGPHGTGPDGRVNQTLYEWEKKIPPSLLPLAHLEVWVDQPSDVPQPNTRTLTPGITVVVPSIPPRSKMLARAIDSILAQTRQPEFVIVAIDRDSEGAAFTRTRGLMQVATEWTAFLDDDDELLPNHLETLEACAADSRADMVFPWFLVVGGQDPFPQHFGKQWDRNDPRQTTITFLVKTELAQRIGGFIEPGDAGLDSAGNRAGEDFRFVIRLSDAGGKIVHVPQRTWIYHHHQSNTSGMSWQQKYA